MWNNRRRKLTAEETAANAQRKADRLKVTMHCQICGRMILANTGVIAHHGYQRPYEGWQTSSCYGARHLPFEVDRSVLGMYIKLLEKMIADQQAARFDVLNDIKPAHFSYTKRLPYSQGSGKETVHLSITRATFAAIKAEHSHAFLQNSLHCFEAVRLRHVSDIEFTIKQIQSDLSECRKRFEGWKQTHGNWHPITGWAKYVGH